MMQETTSKAIPIPAGAPSLVTVKELLFKYFSYLPLIVFCVVTAFGISYLIVRYTEPVYKASIQLMIKMEDGYLKPGDATSDYGGLVEKANKGGGKDFNIENEAIKIKSIALMERVVQKRAFNIKIRNLGSLRSTTLFHDSPIEVVFTKCKDSVSSFSFVIDSVTTNGIRLNKSSVANGMPSFLVYEANNQIKGWEFTVKSKGVLKSTALPLSVNYEPERVTARKILGSLTIGQVGKTSVMQIELKDNNPVRAKEILDELVRTYRMQDVENKQLSNKNTLVYIEKSLIEVNKELDSLEAMMTNERKNTPMYDLAASANLASTQVNLTNDRINSNENLMSEILRLEKKISDTLSPDKIVLWDPAIESTVLLGYVKLYNEYNLKLDQQMPLLPGPDNKIIKDIKNQIALIRYNILDVIQTYKNVFNAKQKGLLKKYNEYNGILASLPDKEKRMEFIKRQASIKRDLNVFLLRKKEEISISTSTILTSYELIDEAAYSNIPVEPKTSNIRNFCLILGLIIPILIIYLIDLFNDKVTIRDQVIKKLTSPIAGEVSHVNTPDKFVFQSSRSIVAEQFRMMRTNLSYLFKGEAEAKVILITSTISGEGKSFISSNLAAALSLADKKVALVLFDLRKAKSAQVIENILNKNRQSTSIKGITNYLIGQIDDIASMAIQPENYSGLHIYPPGPVPPNPAELLQSPFMGEMFTHLRKEYDYIIVDSAPMGLVSDGFLLQEHTDIVLYIIRQQFTLLKQLDFIREIHETKKIKNMAIVVNDVKIGGRYGYYGYSYGYGYNYKYGYGYGAIGTYFTKKKDPNGAYFDMDLPHKKKWWQFFKRS